MIWALDLATNTGECWGRGDELPSLGHVRLPRTQEDVGRFLSAAREWFLRRLDEVCPNRVVFEAPILAKVSNITTVRKLHGLAGTLEMVCFDEGLACFEISTSAVKKALTGKGRAEKSDMVRACRAYGLTPHTYLKDGEEASDEADAFGIWIAAIRQTKPALAARWTPLFAGAAA